MTSTDRNAKASGNSFSQVSVALRKKKKISKQKLHTYTPPLFKHLLLREDSRFSSSWFVNRATRRSVEKHNDLLLTLYEETLCLMTIPYIYILQYSKNTLK